MDEKKTIKFNLNDLEDLSSGTRAKNKTMILSPEATSNFREQLLKETRQELGDQPEGFLPDSDFERTRKISTKPGIKKLSEVVGESSVESPRPQREFYASPELTKQKAKTDFKEETDRTGDHIVFKSKSSGKKLCGFLVCYFFNPEGEFWPIYESRIIVSKDVVRQETPTLIINHESVDSFHAILKVSQGKVYVLDQLSESGTTIIKNSGEELYLSGDKGEVVHGESIRFGQVEFKVCLL